MARRRSGGEMRECTKEVCTHVCLSSRLCPNVEAQHVPGRYIWRVEEVEVEWRE